MTAAACVPSSGVPCAGSTQARSGIGDGSSGSNVTGGERISAGDDDDDDGQSHCTLVVASWCTSIVRRRATWAEAQREVCWTCRAPQCVANSVRFRLGEVSVPVN